MKSTTIVGIMLLLPLCSFPLLAQHGQRDRIKHMVGFNAGMAQFREELLHPKVHGGYRLALEYAFESRAASVFSVGAVLGLSRVSTAYEDFQPGANLSLLANARYGFPVGDVLGLPVFIGPSMAASYSLNYYPNWDDSHLYHASAMSAGINAGSIVSLSDGYELDFSLDVPLLFLVGRPPDIRLYKIDDLGAGDILSTMHRNMDFGLIGRNLVLEFSANFSFPVFGTKQEYVGYRFRSAHLKTSGGAPYSEITHAIVIGVKL